MKVSDRLAIYCDHRAHLYVDRLKDFKLVQINKPPETVAELHGHCERMYRFMPQMVHNPEVSMEYDWSLRNVITRKAFDRDLVLRDRYGNTVGTWGHTWLDFTKYEAVMLVINTLRNYLQGGGQEYWNSWGSGSTRSYEWLIFEVVAENLWEGWFGEKAHMLRFPWPEFKAKWANNTRFFMDYCHGIVRGCPGLKWIGGGDGAMPETTHLFSGWKQEDAFHRNGWGWHDEFHGLERRRRGVDVPEGRECIVDDWKAWVWEPRVTTRPWDRLEFILATVLLTDRAYYMANDWAGDESGGAGNPGHPWWHRLYDYDLGYPVGPYKVESDGVYTREYTKGVVTVHPGQQRGNIELY
jgi:hypothetical protein